MCVGVCVCVCVCVCVFVYVNRCVQAYLDLSMKSFQCIIFFVGKAVNKKLQVNVPDEDGYESIF